MIKVLIDTNILIDALAGWQEAFDELAYYSDAVISVVTWIELMAGATTPSDKLRIQHFLDSFPLPVIHVDETVALHSAEVRGGSLRSPPKISLPDTIIMGTAIATGRTVVTRNTKDFKGMRVRVPYEFVTLTSIRVAHVAAAPSESTPS